MELIRISESSQGTRGRVYINGRSFYTLELPDKNNQPYMSCVPKGMYSAHRILHPTRGWVVKIENVPDRTGILIHSGNWAGDVTIGLKTHSLGCILVGEKEGYLKGQRAVLLSRMALMKIIGEIGKNRMDFLVK